MKFKLLENFKKFKKGSYLTLYQLASANQCSHQALADKVQLSPRSSYFPLLPELQLVRLQRPENRKIWESMNETAVEISTDKKQESPLSMLTDLNPTKFLPSLDSAWHQIKYSGDKSTAKIRYVNQELPSLLIPHFLFQPELHPLC